MVREAEKRQRKFEAKVDAEVLRRQTTALRPLMVKGQRDYFPQIVSLEQRIKRLIEAKGVKTLQVRDYLNYGREILDLSKRFSGITLQAEAQLKTDKWSVRGLDGATLIEVAQLVGVTPTALPSAVVTMPKLYLTPVEGIMGNYNVGDYWIEEKELLLDIDSLISTVYSFFLVLSGLRAEITINVYIDGKEWENCIGYSNIDNKIHNIADSPRNVTIPVIGITPTMLPKGKHTQYIEAVVYFGLVSLIGSGTTLVNIVKA